MVRLNALTYSTHQSIAQHEFDGLVAVLVVPLSFLITTMFSKKKAPDIFKLKIISETKQKESVISLVNYETVSLGVQN